MRKLAGLWRAESALGIGIVLALVNAAVIGGTWGRALGAVLPLLGAGAVRKTVWAPATAVGAVQAAATSVASQLAPDTVGPAGTVLPAAQAVVDGVVAAATGEGV